MPDRDDLLRDLRSRLASRIEGTFTGADGIALIDALLYPFAEGIWSGTATNGPGGLSDTPPEPPVEAPQSPQDEPNQARQAPSTPRTKRGSRGPS